MYQWKKYKASPRSIGGRTCAAARLRNRTIAQPARAGYEDHLAGYRQGYEDRAKQEHQDLIV